jgi:hypothetical protein
MKGNKTKYNKKNQKHPIFCHEWLFFPRKRKGEGGGKDNGANSK